MKWGGGGGAGIEGPGWSEFKRFEFNCLVQGGINHGLDDTLVKN